VTLYRSRRGLDWYVGYIATCLDGSNLGYSWETGLAHVNPSGSFAQSYAYRTTSSDDFTRLKVSVSVSGSLPSATGSPATGLFSAHTIDLDDPADQPWDCQAGVNWQAG
jgi:hypothetical protein